MSINCCCITVLPFTAVATFPEKMSTQLDGSLRPAKLVNKVMALGTTAITHAMQSISSPSISTKEGLSEELEGANSLCEGSGVSCGGLCPVKAMNSTMWWYLMMYGA